MAVADTLRGIITADASGVEKAVSDAEQEMDSLAGRAEKTGKRMAAAGKQMTLGVSVPLAAMGGMAVRQAASFDEAMAQAMSVMGDVSDSMEEDLRDTAREVAISTEHSHEQAAKAFYFLSSAGLDAAESMEALPAAADFATAGNMKLEEATSILTTTMRAYGYEASEMTDVTDMLAATVSSHNTTMEQMSTAMSQVGPVAASLGVGLDETAAAIGAISDAGVQGERAGTALRNVMSQLSDEGSTASKQLQEMGVATRDSSGEILPMVDLLRNMEEAGVDAGDAASIFGMEAGPAMAALMEQGSGSLENYTANVRDSEGAASDMAATQRDTLNKELAETRSQLNDAAVTIGADVLPMVSTLAGYVGSAAESFASLSDRQQKVVLALATLGIVIPPVIWGLGTLATNAAATRSALLAMSGGANKLSVALMGKTVPALLATNVALGPITAPIWAIILAIGALATAAGTLWYAWNNNVLGIRDTTISAFNTVKGWFDAAPTWVLALLGPLGWLYAGWRENLFGVQDLVGTVFDWIGDKIGWLIDKIESIPGIDFSDEDVDKPPIEEAGDAGAVAGSEYKAQFEQAAQPETAALMPTGSGGEVTGEITHQLRNEFSDEEIQDIFEAREVQSGKALHGIDAGAIEEASKQATITPEMLGITNEEFNAILGGGGGSTAAGGGSSPPADLMTSAAGGGGGSGGSSALLEKFDELITTVEDLEIIVEILAREDEIRDWFEAQRKAEGKKAQYQGGTNVQF